jgi:Domain of unknown function (DUF6484)
MKNELAADRITQRDFLELVTAKTEARRSNNGVVIGSLAGLSKSGDILVEFPVNGGPEQHAARSVVVLKEDQIGREVVLMFEEGDLRKPLIIGLVQPRGKVSSQDTGVPIEIEIDGERLVMRAKKEIVLRCGKASITLTRAGKVLICGAYLLSRSSGVNRIKGGSVQIN